MRKMGTIFRRELAAFFSLPVAYVAIAAYLLLSGYFYWVLLIETESAEMSYTFGSMAVIFLFVAPLLTVRLFSEEHRTGTDELLFTAPVSLTAIVFGKYLAALVVYGVMLILTFTYPVLLLLFGNPDIGPLFAGYFGLLLLGASFVAVGVFASATSQSQVVAGLVGLGLLLAVWLMDWVADWLPGLAGRAVAALSPVQHLIDFQKGIVDLSHVLYYVSFAFAFLFLTVRVLDKRRWS